MIKKFAVVLAAVTVLGVTTPASAWFTLLPSYGPLMDPGNGYGDWWGGPFVVGRWGGDVYMAAPVVVARPAARRARHH
jgi:hypothetical protein